MKRIKQMITDCQEENSCKSVISVLSVFYNECRLPGIINGDWEFRIVFYHKGHNPDSHREHKEHKDSCLVTFAKPFVPLESWSHPTFIIHNP